MQFSEEKKEKSYEISEELALKVSKIIGIRLSNYEVDVLASKFTTRNGLDEEAFLNSLSIAISKHRSNMPTNIDSDTNKQPSVNENSKQTHNDIFSEIGKRTSKQDSNNFYKRADGESYYDICKSLKGAILARASALTGNSLLRKAFILLSHKRSELLSKDDLRATCLHSLSLKLTDSQIHTIFNHIDKDHNHLIKTKILITDILKSGEKTLDDIVSRDISEFNYVKPVVIKDTFSFHSQNQLARVSYDNQITGLVEPSADQCLKVTLEELEQLIKHKISDAMQGGLFIRSAMRVFGDTRGKGRGADGLSGCITKQQMRLSLWKTLQIPCSNIDIEKLFKKYGNSDGLIEFHSFFRGIMKESYEPLTECTATRSSKAAIKMTGGTVKLCYDKHILDFLFKLRRIIKDRINRDFRSPVLLLHSTERMDRIKAKAFFESKFGLRIGDTFYETLLKVFNINGLLDVKRIIHDAMQITDGGEFGTDHNLINGSSVTVDKRPNALSFHYKCLADIEDAIRTKIQERCIMSNILSSAHTYFREDATTFEDARYCSKLGLRTGLRKFDIYLNDDDFDAFYRKYAQPDGRIEIRQMLLRMIPQDKSDSNPFVPKSKEEFDAEVILSKQFTTYTGKNRIVSGLNGPSFTSLGRPVSAGSAHHNDGDDDIVKLHNATRNSTFATTANVSDHSLNKAYSDTTDTAEAYSDIGNSNRNNDSSYSNSNSNSNKYRNRPHSAPTNNGKSKGIGNSKGGDAFDYAKMLQMLSNTSMDASPMRGRRDAGGSRPTSPYNSRGNSPYSSRANSPYNSRHSTPNNSRPTSPNSVCSSRPASRSNSRPTSPYSAYSSPRGTPTSSRATSPNNNRQSIIGSKKNRNEPRIAETSARGNSRSNTPTKDRMRNTYIDYGSNNNQSQMTQCQLSDFVPENEYINQIDTMNYRKFRPKIRYPVRNGKFVDSGQHWRKPLDDNRYDLSMKYKAARNNTRKESQAYGIFVKSLTKEHQKRKTLREQFEESKHEYNTALGGGRSSHPSAPSAYTSATSKSLASPRFKRSAVTYNIVTNA